MDLHIRDSSTGYFFHSMWMVVLLVRPSNRKRVLNKVAELEARRNG